MVTTVQMVALIRNHLHPAHWPISADLMISAARWDVCAAQLGALDRQVTAVTGALRFGLHSWLAVGHCVQLFALQVVVDGREDEGLAAMAGRVLKDELLGLSHGQSHRREPGE